MQDDRAEIRLRPYAAEDEKPLAGFLAEEFPREKFTPRVLRSRLLDDPDFDPELTLLLFRGKRLAGFWSGVVRRNDPEVAQVKWFAVARRDRGRGYGTRLADLWEETVRLRGAIRARVWCSVPVYFSPGISTRYTEAISFLWRRGYERKSETRNMVVDLTARKAWILEPQERRRLSSAGVRVRRVRAEEAARFDAYLADRWDGAWRTEAMLALGNDPISAFVAERGGEFVGFAVYDVNQFENSFGPTGVNEELRGSGIGKALLFSCLEDLRRLGHAEAVIGAVGPVPFYHRAAGARIADTFWMMEKPLDPPAEGPGDGEP